MPLLRCIVGLLLLPDSSLFFHMTWPWQHMTDHMGDVKDIIF